VLNGGDGVESVEIRKRRTSSTQPTSGYFSKGTKAGSQPPLGEKVSSDGNGMDVDDEVQGPGPSRRVTIISRPPLPAPSASLESYRLPRTAPPRPPQSGSAFENYSIDGSARPSTLYRADGADSDALPSASQGRTAEQETRHQEWQRRLNAPGGIVPRRRSLALDEAAAAEARRQAGSDADGDDENGTLVVEDMIVDDEEDSRKAAEGIASKLKKKYAAKGVATTGTKAKGKSKKQEEVGPSGQTYTPLEKQFMEIKAENPDVLLLMEGGSYFWLSHARDDSAQCGAVGYKYKWVAYLCSSRRLRHLQVSRR